MLRVVFGALIAVLGVAQAEAAPIAARYACSSSEDLTVQRNASSAHVSFQGRTYDLPRRASSLGIQYISAEAALIIDGPSAVFVGEDKVDARTCMRTVPVASSR